MTVIPGPGVYDGMPEHEYHADPVPGGSLSSSGARKLLPPSCPALFRHELDNPATPTRALDLGTAAHRMVLGLGGSFVVVDADSYRTKAAQQARDEARAAGAAPLLNHEYEQVMAMADAIRAHPVAGALLCRGDVAPEQSLFWRDEEFGIWRRARLDAIRWPRSPGGRILITDYKTTTCADPRQFARSAASYGYHQQDDWYRDGVTALLDADPAFLFVAQEKTPPYLVTVCELDDDAIKAGRERNRRAMEVYAECKATGDWPPYSNDIEVISLPAWSTP